MAVKQVQEGARYYLFDQRLIAVVWRSDDAGDWMVLHEAGTDTPRYRVLDTGELEECLPNADGSFQGIPCDATIDDLVLAVRPL